MGNRPDGHPGFILSRQEKRLLRAAHIAERRRMMDDDPRSALDDPFAPLGVVGFTPASPAPMEKETLNGAEVLRARPRPKSWGESRAAGLKRRRAIRRARAG